MGLPAANLRPLSPATRPPGPIPAARDDSPESNASANSKILPLRRLAELTADARGAGRKIVRYFEQARRTGDLLVVTMTPDRYVDKGPHRPAFPEVLRAEAVASLGCVDFVAMNEWPAAEETLRLLRPHVYVKGSEFHNIGSDMTGKIAAEATAAGEIGAELPFTKDIVFSSSNLINRYLPNLPEELNEYPDLFRRRWSLDQMLETLDRMESLRVLVVGDTILDEYQYCDAIGKSSKDPVIVLRYRSGSPEPRAVWPCEPAKRLLSMRSGACPPRSRSRSRFKSATGGPSTPSPCVPWMHTRSTATSSCTTWSA